MKIYFPTSVLDREDLHPLTPETCRIMFSSWYPRSALNESEIGDHDRIIEIDIPDSRLKALEGIQDESYAMVLRKRAVKSHIGFMYDFEIYEILDAAGIEYEGPEAAPGY